MSGAHSGGAAFIRTSTNSKLSPIGFKPYDNPRFSRRPVPRAPFCSSTYVSIEATCPDTCSFKRRGCYIDTGFTKRLASTLDVEAQDRSAFEVILEEVALIDRAFALGMPQDGARGGRDLRLHVGGETPSAGAAVLLAEAAGRWRARGGGSVWTFTHNWRSIPRAAFGSISALASVETPAQADQALAAGYAPALVVSEFPRGRKAFTTGGVKLVPCPAESGERTCVECRLCFDDKVLAARGTGIAFKAHGAGADQVRTQLGVLRAPRRAA